VPRNFPGTPVWRLSDLPDLSGFDEWKASFSGTKEEPASKPADTMTSVEIWFDILQNMRNFVL
jgi:hypothetical protein